MKKADNQFEWVNEYCVPYTSFQLGDDRPLPAKLCFTFNEAGKAKADKFAFDNNSYVIIEKHKQLKK